MEESWGLVCFKRLVCIGCVRNARLYLIVHMAFFIKWYLLRGFFSIILYFAEKIASLLGSSFSYYRCRWAHACILCYDCKEGVDMIHCVACILPLLQI